MQTEEAKKVYPLSGTFTETLKQARIGDFIILYEGECKSFQSSPLGVIVHVDNQLLLNGTKFLHESYSIRSYKASHDGGVIFPKWNETILYKKVPGKKEDVFQVGRYDSYWSHPKGIATKLGKEIFLNGITARREDPQHLNPDLHLSWPEGGVIIAEKNQILFYVCKQKKMQAA